MYLELTPAFQITNWPMYLDNQWNELKDKPLRISALRPVEEQFLQDVFKKIQNDNRPIEELFIQDYTTNLTTNDNQIELIVRNLYSLNESKFSDKTVIRLDKSRMGCRGAEAVAKLVCKFRSITVTFTNNKIEKYGALQLVEAFIFTGKTSIDFTSNNINADGVQEITESVKKKTSNQFQMNFAGNPVDSYEKIQRGLPSNICVTEKNPTSLNIFGLVFVIWDAIK